MKNRSSKICLICSKPEVVSLAASQEPEPEPHFQEDGKSQLLTENLRSIFILQKLFLFTKVDCVNLMTKMGEVEPREWFQLCQTCTQFVNEFRSTFDAMKELEAKVEGMRRTAESKLRKPLGHQVRPTLQSDRPVGNVEEPTNNNCGAEDASVGFHQSSEPIGKASDDDHDQSPGHGERVHGRQGIRKRGATTHGRRRRRRMTARKSLKPGVNPVNGSSRLAFKKKRQTHGGGVNDKRFECSICERKFIRHAELESHIRVHTREKPFACFICQRGFAQLGTLNAHLRVHTREKPYFCPICNEEFTQSTTKKYHMIRKHGTTASTKKSISN